MRLTTAVVEIFKNYLNTYSTIKQFNRHITKIIGLFILLGLVTFFFIYINRIEKDTRAVETKVSLSAEELTDYIDSEDTEELKLYIDKAIEVEGVVKEVMFKNNIYTLLLTSNKTERLVLCEMQNTETAKIKTIKQGTRVTIKGIYKGALVDAILLNCIFV